MIALENTERYIRNLSPTIALNLRPEMQRRLFKSPDKVIRAIPIKGAHDSRIHITNSDSSYADYANSLC